ncbi:MAG: beta-ribofuranosylaminobenzene 5'-phosphate synthase family protein [Gammaproteobacteria bacterium]
MKTEKQQISGNKTVEVIAPARLHLGFVDMHGGLGRSFGSLGLCLADIFTHLTASESKDVIIQGPSSNRASVYAGRMLEHLGFDKGVEITIHDAIPEHAGLGSGTQLSLAVGTAITRLYDNHMPIREIACIMGRAERSGIGVGTFSTGGFLVDGGRGEDTEVPPIISRLHFPEAWRILLIFDDQMQGISGLSETDAFQQLPPMDKQVTETLCRLTLMQALPALAEEDCQAFGMAITEIQKHVGDYFNDAQDGRFSSDNVSQVLPWLLEQGAAGVGQSSWGPTGFAIYANETQVYQALKQARDKWQDAQQLTFKICRARNEKAEIKIDEESSVENYQFQTY